MSLIQGSKLIVYKFKVQRSSEFSNKPGLFIFEFSISKLRKNCVFYNDFLKGQNLYIRLTFLILNQKKHSTIQRPLDTSTYPLKQNMFYILIQIFMKKILKNE